VTNSALRNQSVSRATDATGIRALVAGAACHISHGSTPSDLSASRRISGSTSASSELIGTIRQKFASAASSPSLGTGDESLRTG
jgi:hypothetical protein